MANKDYNFQYTPLTGRLPGNSFVKQTEQAINELAGIVNEGAAQVEVITNLANQANDNSEVALEKANEALETSGRVYITLPNLDDADDYYDSQLYYFANSYSANLPVEDTGFLEVKTNDTKTACEQVFIADDTGLCYFRHGVITATEVGDETVYSVTWETWSSALASESYVQEELLNYLPLSGGTLTGDVNGVTPPTGDDSKKLANTEFIQALAKILVPTGCVQAFAGSATPNGWLLCDGSAVSRVTYAKLYAVIGTSYGAGDGSTTFNLPNMSGRVAVGSGTGTDVNSTSKSFNVGDSDGEYTHKLIVSEMPAHHHNFLKWGGVSGGLGFPSGTNNASYATSNVGMLDSGGDAYHNNIQPYTVLQYIIKY